MPCFQFEMPALSLAHGMAMERIRSLNTSPGSDPMEQMVAHLNEMENWMCEILAEVPLSKGTLSKVKESSKCHLHKRHQEAPSPPPKNRCGLEEASLLLFRRGSTASWTFQTRRSVSLPEGLSATGTCCPFADIWDFN